MSLRKFALLSLFCLLLYGAQAPRYDLVISGGTIMDGSGSPGYKADIAIQGDAIAAIGKLGAAQARRMLDAQGLIVAPGFIDIHTHGHRGIVLEESKNAQNYVSQGR
jgi:N-acyl-D-aspartate/D-glutamate deacylase